MSEPPPKPDPNLHAPVRIRDVPLRRGTVRVDLLRPILNMARFFVGDTIDRVANEREVYERLNGLIARGVKVKEADKALLNKLIVLLMKSSRDPNKVFEHEANRLLAGMVLQVLEDDYFFIPEVVEFVSNAKLEALARELWQAHQNRLERLTETIVETALRLRSPADVDALSERVGKDELKQLLPRLRLYLMQGEAVAGNITDEARRAAHAASYERACVRATNLIARLLMIPEDRDHARLRRRIKQRELERIEVEALGAEVLGVKEQASRAEALLAATSGELGISASEVDKEEISSRLEEVRMASVEQESDEELGWFFDID